MGMDDLMVNVQPYDENQRPIAVEIKDGRLLVTLRDGRLIGTPLDWYPRLVSASAAQLAAVEFSTAGIHWDDLDEHLSIEGMLAGVHPMPGLPG
jgi:hypothetical protein